MALRLLLSACKQQQPLLMKQLLPAACTALQAAPAAIQSKESFLLPHDRCTTLLLPLCSKTAAMHLVFLYLVIFLSCLLKFSAAPAAATAVAAAVATAPAADVLQQAKASFHSSSSALSADLSSILSKELKHEKAVAEKSEVVAAVSGMLGGGCTL
jgi:hypothetical protein